MISRIVELEQERWHRLGYDTIVTPIGVQVSKSEKVLQLGNETCVLTGIRIGENDLLSNETELVIISPSESVQCTQKDLAMFGTSIIKLFTNFLIIRVRSKHQEIPMFRLDFIKITPISKSNN